MMLVPCLHRVRVCHWIALPFVGRNREFRLAENCRDSFHGNGTRLQERLPSAFGHKHEIQVPIQSGEVSEGFQGPSVELRIDARKLQVLDPEASEGTRAQIKRRVAASLADQNYRLFSACLGIASADMSSSIFSSSLTFTVPPATVTGVMPKSRCFNMTSPR